MLGVEAVAERVADHLVGHYPAMPGASKTSQAVVTAHCLEDSLHGTIMTIVPNLCKMIAAPRVQPGVNTVGAIRRGI
jgi:hypothetical protein